MIFWNPSWKIGILKKCSDRKFSKDSESVNDPMTSILILYWICCIFMILYAWYTYGSIVHLRSYTVIEWSFYVDRKTVEMAENFHIRFIWVLNYFFLKSIWLRLSNIFTLICFKIIFFISHQKSFIFMIFQHEKSVYKLICSWAPAVINQ